MLTKLYVRAQSALVRDEGATAVEYGIMVALIAAVIVGVVATIGQDILKGFTAVEAKLP
jgi:pilus assembly protein Flp/PilA